MCNVVYIITMGMIASCVRAPSDSPKLRRLTPLFVKAVSQENYNHDQRRNNVSEIHSLKLSNSEPVSLACTFGTLQ